MRDDQENDQLKPRIEAKSVQFEEFSTLPDGFTKYIVGDFVGTPLDEIDQFYKDKQVKEIIFITIKCSTQITNRKQIEQSTLK